LIIQARASTFAANQSTIQRLTYDYRLHLTANQVHLYLTRDSTLLMFFANPPSPSFTNHILKSLAQQTSLLRMTADPSMLLQSVLERIAEDVRDIVEQLEKQITLLESKVLLEKPELSQVKHMRVLSSEILMIKEHLLPLDSVVQSLISHETHEMNCFDRHARHQAHSNTLLVEPNHPFHIPPPEQPQFLITKQSEIYLKNLSNQIKELEDSLELFDALTGGLVAFIFNMINFSSSKSSANLALITVIFLPLGFVTGYFGMWVISLYGMIRWLTLCYCCRNFDVFNHVKSADGNVTLFWKVS
jgi:Mg2+ and Co2+ transporter CorA